MDQEITGSCDVYSGTWAAWSDKVLWLNLVILALSALHSALLIKAIVKSLTLMCRIRSWAEAQARVYEDLLRARGGGQAAGGWGGAASGATVPSSDEESRSRKPSVRIDFHNNLDLDGGGELFFTATAVGDGGRAQSSAPTVRHAAASGIGSSLSSAGALGGDGSTLVLSPDDMLAHAHAAAPAPPREVPSSDAAARMREALIGGSSAAATLPTLRSLNTESSVAESSRKSGIIGGGGYMPLHAAPGGDDSAGLSDAQVSSNAAAMDALRMQWSSISWREKLRFVNGWALLSIAADVCNGISCAWNLALRTANMPSDDMHALIMASGVALLWLGVIRYLEHNRTYFNIVLTLRRAGPRVLRFVVGVLPVFFAYGLFAVVVFSDRIPRFTDVRTAFITLFSNLNGDVVRETFMAIVAYYPVTGQLYFYSFIALHIYVVLNIIIAVVEESYFITITKTAEIEDRAEEEATRGDEARAEVAAAVRNAVGAKTAADSGSGAGSAARSAADVPPSPQEPTSAMRASGDLTGSGVTFRPPSWLRSGGEHGTAEAAAESRRGVASPASVADALSSVSLRAGSSLSLLQPGGVNVNLLSVPAHADSDSLKEHPNSKISALLRLAEWDEVVRGAPLGKPAAVPPPQAVLPAQTASSPPRRSRREGGTVSSSLYDGISHAATQVDAAAAPQLPNVRSGVAHSSSPLPPGAPE